MSLLIKDDLSPQAGSPQGAWVVWDLSPVPWARRSPVTPPWG